MPYPAAPVIETSYSALQQAQGDNTFPGAQLDADLANLRHAAATLLNFIKLIQRSDGKLGNATVNTEQLGAGVVLGVNPPGVWETAKAYVSPDTIFADMIFYICSVAHTSGATFAADLASGYWTELIDFRPLVDDYLASLGLTISDAAITFTANGARAFQMLLVEDPENYLSISQAEAGDAVILAAKGTDDDIDLHLNPFGAGVLQVGVALSSVTNAAKSTNRWMPFKDANGVTRYIPVSDTAS